MASTTDQQGNNGAPAVTNGTVSKAALKRLTGEFDLDSIYRLDLSRRSLQNLGCLPDCTSLEFLSLSGNLLTDVSMLSGMKKLRYLDLSANRLCSLAGLEGCDSLLRLDLAGNLIACTEDLHSLTDLTNLESLQLQDKSRDLSNPLCLSAGYAEKIVDLLPAITTLDAIRVRGSGDGYYQLCLEVDQALSGNPTQRGSAASSAASSSASSGLGKDFWSLEALTAASTAASEVVSADKEFAEAVAQLRDRELQTMLCLEEWEREIKKRKS